MSGLSVIDRFNWIGLSVLDRFPVRRTIGVIDTFFSVKELHRRTLQKISAEDQVLVWVYIIIEVTVI